MDGEAIEPGCELWLVDSPATGPMFGENRLAWCERWVLAAEAVGNGGENGRAGYCVDDCRDMFGMAGDTTGSSSPKDTPKARSFASASSCT